MSGLARITEQIKAERRRARYVRGVEAAKKRHRALIETLGGCCEVCGVLDDLEIDHPHGRDWEPRKLSLRQRVKRYEDEHKAGVKLRVLCRSHNARCMPQSPAQVEAAL